MNSKRLSPWILDEINDRIAEYNHPDDPSGGDGGSDDQSGNEADDQGTIILDVTCAPQNILFNKISIS